MKHYRFMITHWCQGTPFMWRETQFNVGLVRRVTRFGPLMFIEYL
jgi:hypothetical protein